MGGQLCYEFEVNVPASQAWELYGSLKLTKLIEQELELVDKIEVVEGDGGVGTLIKIILAPGTPVLTSYSEKFTKVDSEKYIKDAEVVEGGYLNLGFTLYRVRIEIIEKGTDSCIIKTTIEYELKEEAAANASIVSTKPLEMISEITKNYLIKNKT